MKMRLLLVVVLAEWFYACAGGSFPFDGDALGEDRIWRSSQNMQLSVEPIVTDIPDVLMDGPERKGTLPPPLSLPAYRWVPASSVNKRLFAPERGSRPVSPAMRALLLPSPVPLATVTAGVPQPVELLCHLDQMSVRVRRELFGTEDAKQSLFLGTCPVSGVSAAFYYFFYDLRSCGVKMKSLPDSVVYYNSLRYTPPSAGPVVRRASFTIPVECRFHRYYNSYKVGFQPCPRGGTFFKGLRMMSGMSLTAMDGHWKRLNSEDRYILGGPMHFEVKIPSKSGNERVYVNKCYITASRQPNAAMQYTVINNFGCMVDSIKTPLSRFVPHSKKNVLRFTIGSFLFVEMLTKPMTPKTLFLHCEITVGRPRATPTAKSCTYNMTSEVWQELFGNNKACVCCASRCPVPRNLGVRKMISSPPLPVEYDKWSMPAVAQSDHEFTTTYKSIRPTHTVFEHVWDFSE
ncbi:zona pellucida sperm-binding protein 3-like [Scleropages formosus]|uniref:Zona pellucida sperm-binding protein 3 n=1 Tax=Scleropages formosus TaxID=113540 RepID=A0A0P7UGJ8_SCLFO|nr:zona pellucida sperm-binding protein 3-like [Scleropages formosus]